jgi:hypothetical protein
MFDSMMTQPRHDTQVTVFPNRERFEAGVTRVLSHHSGQEDCAVLHVALRGGSGSGTGSVSQRMLNLVGNALRIGTRRGCLVYLGDAGFAVLLQDTDAREAAAYARIMAVVIASFRVNGEDELISASASIGGVMAGDGQQGHDLLEQAMRASQVAVGKHGYQVHMQHVAAPRPRHEAPALELGFA